MATTKVEIISNALILIGDKPINTTAGNERRQVVSESIYDSVLENELSKHRWTFARRKALLSLLTAEPIDNDFSKAYQLPSDLISLIKLNPNIHYQIYGDQIYCDYSQALHCDYIKKVDESTFPAYFTKLMQYAVAQELAVSIRDSKSLLGDLNYGYMNASRMARFTDSAQQPQTPIVDRPFIDVR